MFHLQWECLEYASIIVLASCTLNNNNACFVDPILVRHDQVVLAGMLEEFGEDEGAFRGGGCSCWKLSWSRTTAP